VLARQAGTSPLESQHIVFALVVFEIASLFMCELVAWTVILLLMLPCHGLWYFVMASQQTNKMLQHPKYIKKILTDIWGEKESNTISEGYF
jgi:hypothetical protein